MPKSKPVSSIQQGDVVLIEKHGEKHERVVKDVQEHRIGEAKRIGLVHLPAKWGGMRRPAPVTSVFRPDQQLELASSASPADGAKPTGEGAGS